MSDVDFQYIQADICTLEHELSQCTKHLLHKSKDFDNVDFGKPTVKGIQNPMYTVDVHNVPNYRQNIQAGSDTWPYHQPQRRWRLYRIEYSDTGLHILCSHRILKVDIRSLIGSQL